MKKQADPHNLNLITVEENPFNAEAPLEILADPLTPTQLFYVRNHFDVPTINLDDWRLTIDGAVEQQLELSMEDLRRFTEVRITTAIECAGNGRAQMVPLPAGTPWGYGAIGTAEFTGTPLSLVLRSAGLRQRAVEILFAGADRGEVEPGRNESFARSLPVEVAQQSNAVLAWAMNRQPLTGEHGFPLRLVVPGWYGVASVKWLTKITALEKPFAGYFQREKYVYVGERGTLDGTPVTLMRVRSLITQPLDGQEVNLGAVELRGNAWSGYGSITRVEVSVNGGHFWEEARLPLPWRFPWKPRAPGRYTLMSRATDSAGNMQPTDPVWNSHGYGNNGVLCISVTVR